MQSGEGPGGDLCPRCLPPRPAGMRVTARLSATIGAHARDVTGVAFCGGVLATCSGDKTVRLWSVGSWLELPCSPLRGHAYCVNFIAFSPFGTMLVSCSTDGKAVFWDPKTGLQLSMFTHPSKCSIRAGAFSLNSQLFASGGEDGSVCLWDVLSRSLLRCLVGHCGSVLGLAFSPDSRLLVSGSASGDLRVWDGRVGRAKALHLVLDGHDLGVAGVDVSPCASATGTDGKLCYTVATGGSDNLVKIWRLTAPISDETPSKQHRRGQGALTFLVSLKGHSRAVMAVRFSPNGKLLISCSGDHTVRIWRPETASSLHVVEAHSRYVTSCCFSSDGQRLASGSNDRLVRVWDLAIEDDGEKLESARPSDREDCVSEGSDSNSCCCSGNSCSEDDADATCDCAPSSSVAAAAWTVGQVARLLARLGLEAHAAKFCRRAIDGRALLGLTDARLRTDLGIDAPSHRQLLLDAIGALNSCRAPTDSHQGAPDEYLCPVTQELMRDPVIAADGYTYERAAIESWFQLGRAVSPMTGEPVAKQLIPNRSLRVLIQRYLADRD